MRERPYVRYHAHPKSPVPYGRLIYNVVLHVAIDFARLTQCAVKVFVAFEEKLLDLRFGKKVSFKKTPVSRRRT